MATRTFTIGIMHRRNFRSLLNEGHYLYGIRYIEDKGIIDSAFTVSGTRGHIQAIVNAWNAYVDSVKRTIVILCKKDKVPEILKVANQAGIETRAHRAVFSNYKKIELNTSLLDYEKFNRLLYKNNLAVEEV